jgi:hypothetical protein
MTVAETKTRRRRRREGRTKWSMRKLVTTGTVM